MPINQVGRPSLMIKPHFLINHHIYKLIFMLYVMSVLCYVLCQKNSQSIWTIHIFPRQTWQHLSFSDFFRVCVDIYELVGRHVMNRYKQQRYYILGYSVKIVQNTLTTSFFLPCLFYEMESYICNTESPLTIPLSQETQEKTPKSPVPFRIV